MFQCFYEKMYSVCIVWHDNDLSFIVANSAIVRLITWQFVLFFRPANFIITNQFLSRDSELIIIRNPVEKFKEQLDY